MIFDDNLRLPDPVSIKGSIPLKYYWQSAQYHWRKNIIETIYNTNFISHTIHFAWHVMLCVFPSPVRWFEWFAFYERSPDLQLYMMDNRLSEKSNGLLPQGNMSFSHRRSVIFVETTGSILSRRILNSPSWRCNGLRCLVRKCMISKVMGRRYSDIERS